VNLIDRILDIMGKCGSLKNLIVYDLAKDTYDFSIAKFSNSNPMYYQQLTLFK
jgi:hypothetical protein